MSHLKPLLNVKTVHGGHKQDHFNKLGKITQQKLESTPEPQSPLRKNLRSNPKHTRRQTPSVSDFQSNTTTACDPISLHYNALAFHYARRIRSENRGVARPIEKEANRTSGNNGLVKSRRVSPRDNKRVAEPHCELRNRRLARDRFAIRDKGLFIAPPRLIASNAPRARAPFALPPQESAKTRKRQDAARVMGHRARI